MLRLRLSSQSILGDQPIRSYILDLPGRVRDWKYLQHGANTGRVFLAGGEFGLFRFDGVRAVPWQPPAGQELPEKFAFLLASTPDGTLWIGTFSGLASWDGIKLTRRPEFADRFVQSLFVDHQGTVWAGTRGGVRSYARLCAIRRGSSK